MSVSTWAPARQITDDAVDVRPEVAIPPGSRVAVVGRRARGGVAARERFSRVSRPALRLVPPLPAGVDWPADPTASSHHNRASEPAVESGRDAEPHRTARSDGTMRPGGTGWIRRAESSRSAESVRPAQSARESRVAGVSAQAVLADSPLADASIPGLRSTGPAADALQVGRANASARARSAHAPVRLTRRGRLVLAGLLLAFVAALVGVLASTVQAAAPSAPPRAVVVHQGDTLWSIAARVHPRGSLTDTMLTIERLNHMTDGTVYVGQQLLVPNS
jgi:LysM repeat protein